MLTRGHPRQEKHQRMLDPEPVASTKRPKTRSEEEPSLAPTWNSDPEAPAPSAAAEAKTPTLYAMEIGASHFQLMYKKPGKEWTCKTWPALGDNWGMESRNVIPTMVALEHAPKNEEVPTYYGREALDIAKTSSRFDTFRYLKLAYVDDADNRLPSLIKRTLKQQEKLARSYGWRSKGIASLFFDNALKELSKDDGKTAVLYFNVIDIWPNAVSQKLLDRFQELLPGVKIHAIDECLSSVFGTHHGEASGNCALLTVDCGHSTTNVCRLRPSKKERHYQIEDYEPLPLGAGIINAAAEEEVRNINRIRQRNLEQDVLNVSCFVDALKHDMGNCDSSSFGYNEDEWQRIIKAAKDANVKLDRERIQVIDSLLGKNKVEAPRERIKVILTGGASQSKTFQDGLRDMVSRRYPNVEVCPTGSCTAVLAGLQHIAENPEILHVDRAPLSLWMRSDANDPDGERAVRACRKGQKLNPQTNRGRGPYDRNPSNPIRFELESEESFELDLSIFATPDGIRDQDIFTQDSPDTDPDCIECFVYAQTKDLERFGRIEKKIPLSAPPADGSCHVYVFSKLNAIEVELHAVFAADGREIKSMEVQKLMSIEYFREHVADDLEILRLGQVARPEDIFDREIGPY